jgi:cytoskeleton protein RodZ
MQNIGERLEEARKRKGISIREAAEATKVRGDYLHKFESSQFDINLPDIYVRGFLRAYANYLGLTGEKIVNDYNALGHGNPEPKGLNREIYGRMDLTLGSSQESAREPDNATRGEEADDENPATFKPSPGALPYIDRGLIIKGAAVLAAVVALVLIVWLGVRTWGGGGIEDGDPEIKGAIQTTTEPQIIIHALDTVRIKVVDESTGEELFQDSITRGDSRSFPITTSLLLTADPIENVEIEKDGTRFPTNSTGRKRVRIE